MELLNFGAFVGFILVNLSVICYYHFRPGRRCGVEKLANLLFPSLGVLFCTWVWLRLSHEAELAGFARTGLGVVSLPLGIKGFRSPLSRLEV